MTRKDYERVAARLRLEYVALRQEDERFGFRLAVSATADAMKDENPLFNRDRFYEAVGILDKRGNPA